MRVYVAGATENVAGVRAVQEAVVAAGHELTLDWTRGPEAGLASGHAAWPDLSARIAAQDLDAVLAAEAVLLVVSHHHGRGMFVELGAALARARRGELEQVVVIGPDAAESVFLRHPALTRVATVEEWLRRQPSVGRRSTRIDPSASTSTKPDASAGR